MEKTITMTLNGQLLNFVENYRFISTPEIVYVVTVGSENVGRITVNPGKQSLLAAMKEELQRQIQLYTDRAQIDLYGHAWSAYDQMAKKRGKLYYELFI